MRYLDEKAEKTAWQLLALTKREAVSLDDFYIKFCDYKNDNVIPDIDQSWQKLEPYMLLDGKDMHCWIRGSFRTPKAIDGCYYALEFEQQNKNSRIQVLLYLNGEMTQGLDVNHTRTFLKPDTEYDAAFYCYFDSISPFSGLTPKLITVCSETEQLYFDFYVPLDALYCLDKASDDYRVILHHLEFAANRIDFRKPYSDEYYEGIHNAREYLKHEFYEKECGKNKDVTVNCMGHSHIDVAWRWPVRQTVEKVQRSYSTVIHLMERYPEYRFMMTSPQLYVFLKENAPEMYEKVKARIRDGRWEADGAMWLEADGNLPSGESFIRQLVFGKRFFKEEFGVNSRTLWIPDVFGYSAALPQILKKAGVDRFVTGKISWNDTNRIPNDTFYWKGIDGSEIFTQFLTTKDFVNPDKSREFVMINGAMDSREVKSSWDIYRNKEYNNQVIHTFGFGDGGGGPTFEMLERQRRFEKGIPGIPMTKMNTLDDFLNKAERNFRESCEKFGRTPKWSGELYLEYHRGTYTSMAKTKKFNRDCEFALMKAEGLAALDSIVNGKAYPSEKFSDMWKIMLLNQFHDIIPGSSIKEVYDLSDEQYGNVLDFCNEASKHATEDLLGKISTPEGYTVFNPHSHECSDVVEAEGSFAYAGSVPSFGYKGFSELSFENSAEIEKNHISNKYFDIRLDENGNIISIFDKINMRETVSGTANRFCVYEDMPKFYDAWELTYYYKQKCYEVNEVAEIFEYRNGAKAGLTVVKRFMDSVIKQNIVVYDNIPRVDFETEIDWKQSHLIMKSLFPVNVFSNKVTAEIQFGHVERATHENTGWDQAKFEMCMHKWVDISDNSYGVSLLNDCKYGFSADENVLGITILKSSTEPNPEADKCVHHLTYSWYPHKFNAVAGGTVQQAYNLNQKMTAVKTREKNGELPSEYSFVKCNEDNIVIETLKQSEDEKGYVLRLYDAHNTVSKPEISFGFDVKNVWICDLLENKLEKLEVKDNKIKLSVGNFEIVTLHIER